MRPRRRCTGAWDSFRPPNSSTKRASSPRPAYTFKHALTHEVAYNSLLQERRRALHARIVETIAGLSADRLTEQVERLAHHALRGEVWDKALAYCRQAGAKAATRSAYREAVAYFEQALTALGHLPAHRETLEQAIDLRLDIRSALIALGELGAIFYYMREAETLATALDDQRRLGWICAYMTASVGTMGNQKRASNTASAPSRLPQPAGTSPWR